MTLLLSREALDRRKMLLRDAGAVGGLADSLQRELHQVLDVPVPEGKSRLTRNGGRCVSCTVLLTFDPRQPDAHRCPNCATVYTDRVHHEWWLMNAHLWTAEQCTRAAALAFLCDDDRAGVRADQILEQYASLYLTWPNQDNALGPTRPFFSTYLESIWLLHLTVAVDLRDAAANGSTPLIGRVRDQLIEPSARLIASFNEGRSNRQVWHAAALLAASRLLGDTPLHADARRSLLSLLRDGLHVDGSWYEGENYHLFAHRGLLTAVTLAEAGGLTLPPDLASRFSAGFAAPFRTMFPDGTFPARRDSQYGVSLRQCRTADWIECGFARGATPALRAALASLYSTVPLPGDTGRACSTADAERNQRSVRLTRADCSWRALLLAAPDLPPIADATPSSALLEGQGLAVFRRDAGRFWVGLDYGDPGDGHGHPDRLNLVIATEQSRWLDDVGTGSYTSPTLPWYRSSMAHNSPIVNGRDQGTAWGTLVAYDEQPDIGTVTARFHDPCGVSFTRSLLVCDDHVVDVLSWTADCEVNVDLPLQAKYAGPHDAVTGNDAWSPFVPRTSQDAMLTDPRVRALNAGVHVALRLQAMPSSTRTATDPAVADFQCSLWSATPAVLWCAGTIGAPGGSPHGLVSLRQSGHAGQSLRVFSACGAQIRSAGHGAVQVTSGNGTVWTHVHLGTEWRSIISRADGTSATTLLAGGQRTPTTVRHVEGRAPLPAAPQTADPKLGARWDLGKRHYRMTEASWEEAGSPTASLRCRREGTAALVITVQVELHRVPAFAPHADINPLDNELPDVNSDGVQLHWLSAVTGEWNSVLAVPEGAAVRLSVVDGAPDGLACTWTPSATGFELQFHLPWAAAPGPFVFDCIVNERPGHRERRRGQLVLSGAEGASAYLRGARQSADRALTLVFDPIVS